MAWLRIDDGFVEHPKLIELGGPAQRWAWLEVLGYCARRQTCGKIPEGVGDVVRRATPALLAKAEEVGLIERLPDGSRVVHHWDDYNPKDPTKAERQARWRANRNGPVDGDVDGDVDDSTVYTASTRSSTETGPPARAGARGPSPTPTPKKQQQQQVLDVAAAAELLKRLEDLKIPKSEHQLILAEPERATAWLNLAHQEARRNPAGYFRKGFATGSYPAPRSVPEVKPPMPYLEEKQERVRAMVKEHVDPDEIRDLIDNDWWKLTDDERETLHGDLERQLIPEDIPL